MDAAPATHDAHADLHLRTTRPAWVAPAIVGGLGLAACLALRAANPTTDTGTPLCPFKLMTGGVDCPGCGASRATNALLHGHLGVAADHNLLFVLLVPFALVAYATWALRSIGVEISTVRPPRHWLPALGVVVAVFWALRLLPWEPFAWLASGRA